MNFFGKINGQNEVVALYNYCYSVKYKYVEGVNIIK